MRPSSVMRRKKNSNYPPFFSLNWAGLPVLPHDSLTPAVWGFVQGGQIAAEVTSTQIGGEDKGHLGGVRGGGSHVKKQKRRRCQATQPAAEPCPNRVESHIESAPCVIAVSRCRVPLSLRAGVLQRQCKLETVDVNGNAGANQLARLPFRLKGRAGLIYTSADASTGTPISPTPGDVGSPRVDTSGRDRYGAGSHHGGSVLAGAEP